MHDPRPGVLHRHNPSPEDQPDFIREIPDSNGEREPGLWVTDLVGGHCCGCLLVIWSDLQGGVHCCECLGGVHLVPCQGDHRGVSRRSVRWGGYSRVSWGDLHGGVCLTGCRRVS